jgi:hypothetical protein
MRAGLACAVLVLAVGSVSASFADAVERMAVVKYVKGSVHATVDSVGKDLLGSDLVVPGQKIQSAEDGKAVLRLLPDQAFLEVRSQTAFSLKKVKSGGKRMRRLMLESGEVVLGLRKKSQPVQCETTHSLATAATGRFSCKTDEKGAETMVVQDGEVSVYNRPKDLTAVVRKGQKAVSDLNGIRVTDASDSELEQVGFRQNTLEVDFVNPTSEDFSTLEIEYETNF